MKKKFFIGAMALLSVFTMALTSCDNDDDPTTNGNIEFKDMEFGHDNEKVGTIVTTFTWNVRLLQTLKSRALTLHL